MPVASSVRFIQYEHNGGGSWVVERLTPIQVRRRLGFILTDGIVRDEHSAITYKSSPPLIVYNDGVMGGLGVKADGHIKEGKFLVYYSGALSTHATTENITHAIGVNIGPMQGKFIDAFRYRNEAALFNHAFRNRKDIVEFAKTIGIIEVLDIPDDVQYANCEYVYVHLAGRPGIKAIEDLKPRQRLYTCYGIDYWVNLGIVPTIINKKGEDITFKVFDIRRCYVESPALQQLGVNNFIIDISRVSRAIERFDKNLEKYLPYRIFDDSDPNNIEKNKFIIVSVASLKAIYSPTRFGYHIEGGEVYTYQQLLTSYHKVKDFYESFDTRATKVDKSFLQQLEEHILLLEKIEPFCAEALKARDIVKMKITMWHICAQLHYQVADDHSYARARAIAKRFMAFIDHGVYNKGLLKDVIHSFQKYLEPQHKVIVPMAEVEKVKVEKVVDKALGRYCPGFLYSWMDRIRSCLVQSCCSARTKRRKCKIS